MSWCRRRTLLPFLLVAFAACADDAAQQADPARTGGTVVVALLGDLENLNSLVAGERYTQELNRYALFLPLVHYAPDLSYEPALAEHWELLGDTGAVFHLRRDVRWHDGVQTTARDVLFTYERAQDSATAFPNAEYFTLWSDAVAEDSFTVRFSFEPHAEPLAGLPFLPIMPAHLLDTVPSDRMRQAAFNKAPVGNGPFRFHEYRANDRWVFVPNEEFPEALGGRPNIDRLVLRPIPDATAQLTELQTARADMILTPKSDQFRQLSAEPGLRGIERPGRQFANMILNGRIEPFDDPSVRRALTMAIDRQQIVNTLRAGYGSVAVGPIGSYHWAFDESMAPLPFNPDSARALLAAAGIRDADGDGVAELPSGEPFEIELKIPANSVINRDMAELIRGNLAAVGVKVEARQTDFATMIQDFTGPSRNFEGILLAWESDFRLNLRDLYHSEAMSGPYQMASYSNPRVDSLIDAAALAMDRGAAQSIYSQLQTILRDEQPWNYLYYYPDLVLMRDRLQNVKMDIRGAFVNVAEWWVSEPAPGDSAARSPTQDQARAR